MTELLLLALACAVLAVALSACLILLVRVYRRERACAALATVLSDDKAALWRQVMDLHAGLAQAGEALADLDAQRVRVTGERDAALARARTAEGTTRRLLEMTAEQRAEQAAALAARDAEHALAVTGFAALVAVIAGAPRALPTARPPMPELLPGGNFLVAQAGGKGLILQTDDLGEVGTLCGPRLPGRANGTGP